MKLAKAFNAALEKPLLHCGLSFEVLDMEDHDVAAAIEHVITLDEDHWRGINTGCSETSDGSTVSTAVGTRGLFIVRLEARI
jgi:hypothetical protein